MIVSEIFRSLQGEGRNQGRPCTFVRLSGCNLDCRWCDTRYAREGGEEVTVDAVAAQVVMNGGSRVCITGGEPLLQKDEVAALARRLSAEGFSIEVETNGTIDFSQVSEFLDICMDVKCPSSGEQSDLRLLEHITEKDSVKFVVADTTDLDYAASIIDAHTIRGECFFSPVYGSPYAGIARYVIDHDLPGRVQVQLHKVLGVR